MTAKKKNRVGRPKIEIDWNEFEKLCFLQCTLEEISSWFKCSEDTIERRCKENKKMNFADFFLKASAGGKISLRRAQFKSATGGNPALLIFLGKQYLGQKDKYELEHSGKDGGAMQHEHKLSVPEAIEELKKRGVPVPDFGDTE